MAAASGGGSTAVAASEGTLNQVFPAETGRAGFPRPFLFVPVAGPIPRDNPAPINALGRGLGRRAGSERSTDLLTGPDDRLLPCAAVEISIPADVALFAVQLGETPPDAKPLKGFGGAGVLELIEDHRGDTYRAVYTVRFATKIYVQHVFQKKSKRGIATPKRDLELIRERLKWAERLHAGKVKEG